MPPSGKAPVIRFPPIDKGRGWKLAPSDLPLRQLPRGQVELMRNWIADSPSLRVASMDSSTIVAIRETGRIGLETETEQ